MRVCVCVCVCVCVSACRCMCMSNRVLQGGINTTEVVLFKKPKTSYILCSGDLFPNLFQ